MYFILAFKGKRNINTSLVKKWLFDFNPRLVKSIKNN